MTPPLTPREADLLAALKLIATTPESREYMRGIALAAIARAEEKA